MDGFNFNNNSSSICIVYYIYIFVVDFNYILERACSQEMALGEMLRLCEHRCGQKLKSEARIQIVEVQYSLIRIN